MEIKHIDSKDGANFDPLKQNIISHLNKLSMNNRTLLKLCAAFLLISSLFVVSCKEEDDQISDQKLVAGYGAEAALEWNKLFLEIERYAASYRPGPTTRPVLPVCRIIIHSRINSMA